MDESAKYQAIQTQHQIRALCLKLDKSSIISQIKIIKPKLDKIQRSKIFNEKECLKWLKNSWNTERILRISQNIVEKKDNYFALQWSFPQAYYSVFCCIQAYFYATGQSDKSHVATLNCFSNNITNGIFPKNMCFSVTGYNEAIKFTELDVDVSRRSLELNESESGSIDTRIARFLKSTREMLLKEKKDKLNKEIKHHSILQTKSKKASKKLNTEQWMYISNMVESTTILHLLYRKRIKANYQDIETFQYPGLESDLILKDLIEIVSYMNFVHEYLIVKYIGLDKLNGYAQTFDNCKSIDWFQKRIDCIKKNI